jgi:hypothetical protein
MPHFGNFAPSNNPFPETDCLVSMPTLRNSFFYLFFQFGYTSLKNTTDTLISSKAESADGMGGTRKVFFERFIIQAVTAS